MSIIVPLQRSPQSIRIQIEQALHSLPWADSELAELRLRIEEAIEVSYEVELARSGPVRRRPLSAF